jgi:hypothetical protein
LQVRNKLITLCLVVFCVAALGFAGTAIAQTPTSDTYNIVAGLQEESGGGGGGGNAPQQQQAQPAEKGGNLPFTGFEAGMAALLGVALIGTGLVVRRTVRSSAHA